MGKVREDVEKESKKCRKKNKKRIGKKRRRCEQKWGFVRTNLHETNVCAFEDKSKKEEKGLRMKGKKRRRQQRKDVSTDFKLKVKILKRKGFYFEEKQIIYDHQVSPLVLLSKNLQR